MASPDPESSDEDNFVNDSRSSPNIPGAEIDRESDSDNSGDDPDIDFKPEDDVPHPKNPADLQNWLQISDQHLATLRTVEAPPQRGNYHNRKVGKELSVRRQQELRKAEKERNAREKQQDLRRGLKSSKINDFFAGASRSPAVVPQAIPAIEISDAENTPFVDSDSDTDSTCDEGGICGGEVEAASFLNANLGLAPEREHSVPPLWATVDDAEDEGEGEDSISLEPCQLSPEARAEEGLDDLPWDPSDEVLPRDPHTPAPAERADAPAGPAEFVSESFPHPSPPSSTFEPTCFPSERGFTMPNRPQRKKFPSPLPSNCSVDVAIQKLQNILHPRRATGRGHNKSKVDLVTSARLECMIRFLRLYKSSGYTGWTMHSETIATASGKSGSKTWLGRKIREWSIKFCEDSKNIPDHQYGRWHSSILSDKDIAGDIHLHLQSLGKWVSAKDIARYVATPEFQARLHIKRKITVRTTQRWMKKMGYRWRKEPKGMYSDGHERADVVHYRQNVFLPRWRALEARTRWWNQGLTEEQWTRA
ncbi:hypothetical protein DFH09DRAFT_1283931 [Mycena vulgaris]|nr:hypothetical protein DFH09DRAFT_1283931 [Mycena vulgaris]